MGDLKKNLLAFSDYLEFMNSPLEVSRHWHIIHIVGGWVPWYHIVLLYYSSTVHRGGIYQVSVRSIHYSPQRDGICQFSVQSVHYSCNFEATRCEICKSYLCGVTIVNPSELKLVNFNSVQCSVLLISCYVLVKTFTENWVSKQCIFVLIYTSA